ncbi:MULTISPECIES: transcriptional regulator RcsA [unclassified Tatumella]|uniref:transcriptional regulator RcsA n=1 Tax=unclassified Tatumella TaxID=2649542 RepID=UPI001BAF7218|nr:MULTISPECIES: transcriptional regulator RcsA [unclassified Tatumella]MBS0878032.1 transcriptional regulator RcsA [Tatumella sp. JGM82]MBS0891245.1 transcriptional regulator RcsA [Tatumella sp. JGM94]MBS0902624.1 transcriptional regulator RcsA [Tatumella sp. JGM100]
MSSVIIDPCHFTRTGLKEYLNSQGVISHCCQGVINPQQLKCTLDSLTPSLVFISEQCLDNHCRENSEIKKVIAQYPDTVFFIFMALPNSHFSDHLYLRENIIVTTKALDKLSLERLISPYLSKTGKKFSRRSRQPVAKPVALSRAESDMLKMWMSGYDTLQIAGLMQIKAKTISSHKGNIKKKIKTQNKQVIYHLVKLTQTLTTGLHSGH